MSSANSPITLWTSPHLKWGKLRKQVLCRIFRVTAEKSTKKNPSAPGHFKDIKELPVYAQTYLAIAHLHTDNLVEVGRRDEIE